MIKYAIDIDGTICNNTWGDYQKAQPNLKRIEYINKLYDSGNIIKMFTARGSVTKKDWYEFTYNQLKSWGLKFNELILGKPDADIFIDDKACHDSFWLWEEQDHNLSESISLAASFFERTAVSFSHLSRDYNLLEKINTLGNKLANVISVGGKIIFAGNGGSFADSQHIAAEFISKLNVDRNPLPSIALGTNSSNLTAIGNDYGYEFVFSREFEAIANKSDFLVAITTSGESLNILNLQKKAMSLGIESALLTGPNKNSTASKLSDLVINTSNEFTDTASIQQMHIAIGHFLCDIAQKEFI